MTVAVVSALYGSYDLPNPLPAQSIECEAVLVSDRSYEVEGWHNVVDCPPSISDPRLAAKIPKTRPDRYVDAEIVVWLDAHVEVRSRTFIAELVDQLGNHEWGAFRHTFIHSISGEAALASKLPKYHGYNVVSQARHYLDQGHPDEWGIWTTGLTIRRMTDRVKAMGDSWMAEMEAWGTNDQISQPFVLRKHGIIPKDLPFEGWWAGKRFMLKTHTDGTG